MMDTDLDLLRFVFTFHIVDQIVHADDTVEREEIDWVVEKFPREVLLGHGMIDEGDALTERYRDLLAEALLRVPAELSVGQKSELIQTFFATALSDGEFEAREGEMIVIAAQLLGLPTSELTSHLPDLGELEFDD